MASAEQRLIRPDKPEQALLDHPQDFNFQPDSIGYVLFFNYHDLLAGRRRPVTIFKQVPRGLHEAGIWQEAAKRGFKSVEEVLCLPYDDLTPPTFSERFANGLASYVAEELTMTPHVRLVKMVFEDNNYSPIPFPPALEQEFTHTVEEQVGKIPQREGDLLIYRYGLYDGIPQSLQQVASLFGVSRGRISQLEARALRRLRRSPSADLLAQFTPFPKDSLGRDISGPGLRRYLPDMTNLQLSDLAAAQLRRYGVLLASLPLQLEENTTGLQRKNIDCIAVLLYHGLTHPQTAEKHYTNNLLARLPISNDQLLTIGNLKLAEAGLPTQIVNAFARHEKSTFGDVLAMTPPEFAKIRTLGKLRAFQFGMKLEELLKLPVARLLADIVRTLKQQALIRTQYS
ncbi:hypothetical protein HYW41_00865 [Candidatus Daviesbacteria bacterium]|nr:hypothetical protein [Candidatus Daviesbacteria bacterium]